MPTLLWEPPAGMVERALMTRFMRERGHGSYDELWRWSVEDLEGFWASIWEFFGVEGDYDRVLGSTEMPGAEWFPGASVNYAEHLFRGKDDETVAIVHASELRELSEWTWGDLRRETARMAARLRALDVKRGDRVAAYMPNLPETVAAFLATASLGAVWSSCSPDFGAPSVIDRFAQIEPKVLLSVDGYRYNGRDFERQAPDVGAEHVVRFGYLDGSGWPDEPDGELSFERVPFDHPLWVLYSSGTTGLPKAIVQGQGGILLEHLKKLNLHVDAQAGDRLFWFTTTGWMMWNFLVSGLLTEAAIVLYDGSPGHPDMGVLWDLADQAGITTFGTSAAYIAACMKAEVEPAKDRDLSKLRAIGSTGSPLSP
jgi:acetoacetyl-CoA synthetase